MKDLKQDLSQITSISVNTLEKLTAKIIALISHYTYEDTREHKSMTDIDIGIGNLYIDINSDIVRYKFVPTKKLVSSVKKSINGNANDLMKMIETTLVKRVEDTYKELF